MIEWLTVAALEDSLGQVPPIGLGLRGFLYGRLPMSLATLFDRPPETAKIEGVGDVITWAGVADGTPFTVTGQRRGEVTGFEISLPIAIKHGLLDIGLLYVVEALAPAFHTARGLRIESLPYAGGGFGVVPKGSDDPIFRSSVREDATTLLAFLNDAERYELAILPAAPVQWIVAGPRLGATISRLEVVPTKEMAEELVKSWTAEMGQHFEIFEGQLPA